MTRRERLEAKAEKRRQWAESRRKKAAARFAASSAIVGQIPMGQPILIGHHSEKRHRRDLERSHNHMAAGFESQKMADHHESKADGLESQLERSIFSDDADAIERLEEKAKELDAAAELCNAINKAWRKHQDDETALFAAWKALGVSDALCVLHLKNAKEYSWTRAKGPCDAKYDRANARRCRLRIEDIKRRNARAKAAEEAGGMKINRSRDGIYCTVMFAEKPAREIIDALKAGGFHWSGGAWHGRTWGLPQCVKDLETPPAAKPDPLGEMYDAKKTEEEAARVAGNHAEANRLNEDACRLID